MAELTKAQRGWLHQHRPGETLDRFSSRKTWPFVDRCAAAGWIEIVDPDKRFPWSWEGTRITPAGREALSRSKSDE